MLDSGYGRQGQADQGQDLDAREYSRGRFCSVEQKSLLLHSLACSDAMLLAAADVPPIRSQVQPADYEAFSLAYGTLLKTSLSSLRKKRKTKRKAPTGAAAKELAAAKASGAAFAVRLTKVVGPRRGAGVEKRRKLQRRRAKELVKLAARRKRDETR